MKTKLLLTTGFIFCFVLVYGQDTTESEAYKPSKTQFMIRGYAHAGFNYKKVGDEVETTYVGSSFSPIFLFNHNNKLLFEAELQFAFDGDEVEIDFEYANFSYVLNDYMILRGGKFLLPFGTFIERLHPAWVNKFTNMPLGFGHDGIAPASGIGFEVRGALPLGSAKLLYYVYSTNGPKLNNGLDEPEEAGMLHFNNFEDNNNNKAFGGRLALLPFSNSALEIGASYYGGIVGDRDDPDYGNIGANLYAFDFSFVRQIGALGGTVDLKGQYNLSDVDQATYFELEPGDTIPTAYTFENKSSAYFAQLAYRPTKAASDILKNFELVGRYSTIKTPEGSEWEQHAKQWSVGLNYWLSWRTLIKVNYHHTISEGGHDSAPGEEITTNGLFVHWAMGF